jgi:hypothetical protein
MESGNTLYSSDSATNLHRAGTDQVHYGPVWNARMQEETVGTATQLMRAQLTKDC